MTLSVRLSVRVRREVSGDNQLFELGGRPMEKNREHHAAFDEPVGETISNSHLASSITSLERSLASNTGRRKWFRQQHARDTRRTGAVVTMLKVSFIDEVREAAE